MDIVGTPSLPTSRGGDKRLFQAKKILIHTHNKTAVVGQCAAGIDHDASNANVREARPGRGRGLALPDHDVSRMILPQFFKFAPHGFGRDNRWFPVDTATVHSISPGEILVNRVGKQEFAPSVFLEDFPEPGVDREQVRLQRGEAFVELPARFRQSCCKGIPDCTPTY